MGTAASHTQRGRPLHLLMLCAHSLICRYFETGAIRSLAGDPPRKFACDFKIRVLLIGFVRGPKYRLLPVPIKQRFGTSEHSQVQHEYAWRHGHVCGKRERGIETSGPYRIRQLGEKAPQPSSHDGWLSVLPILTGGKGGPSRFPCGWQQVANRSRLAFRSFERLAQSRMAKRVPL